MLKADGLDAALIGLGGQFHASGRQSMLVYSVNKILEILVDRDGMTYEEAWEFFEFNIAGSYNGPGMPVFMEEDVDHEILLFKVNHRSLIRRIDMADHGRHVKPKVRKPRKPKKPKVKKPIRVRMY